MYAFITISLLSLSLLEYANLIKSRTFVLLSAFTLVVLTTGLRGFAGTDTYNYFVIVNNIESYNNILEFGFYYTTLILNLFVGNNFSIYLILLASISNLFYFAALSKLAPKQFRLLAFIIVFCDLYLYFNFSGMRQGIALSAVLLGYYFLIYRRTILFFLMCLIAISFHKSAIVAPFLFAIMSVNGLILKNKIFVIVTGLVCILVAVWQDALLDFIRLVSFRGSEMYLSASYNEYTAQEYLLGIVRRSYLLVFIFGLRLRSQLNVYNLRLLNLYIIGTVIFILLYPTLPDLTVRIVAYFQIVEAVLVVSLLATMRSKLNLFLMMSVVLALVIFKVFQYSRLESYAYL